MTVRVAHNYGGGLCTESFGCPSYCLPVRAAAGPAQTSDESIVALSMWVRFLGRVPPGIPESFANLLERAGIGLTFPTGAVEGFGAAVFEQVDDTVLDELRTCAAGTTVLAICIGRAAEPGAAVGAVTRRRQGRAGLAQAAGRRRSGGLAARSLVDRRRSRQFGPR